MRMLAMIMMVVMATHHFIKDENKDVSESQAQLLPHDK